MPAMMTPHQIRAARALLGWTQADLADKAGLSAFTLTVVEAGSERARSRTLSKIAAAFDAAGVLFLEPGEGGGPGVRLKG